MAAKGGCWSPWPSVGARLIGMWTVVGDGGRPAAGAGEEDAFDEVDLAMGYATVEPWQATRDATRHGGNGPDSEACRAALEPRRAPTLQSHVFVLQGESSIHVSTFMPGSGRRFRLVEE